MIPTSVRRKNVPAWQRSLATAITDPAKLLSLLDIDPDLSRPRLEAANGFPLRVPRAHVQRMQPGDPDDPLLLQVLPRRAEDREAPGFVTDPVGERAAMARPGLLHTRMPVVLPERVDDALAGLSRRLFAFGTLPYYLHLLDPVQGAAHFEVSEREGVRLLEDLARTLPGYLVPRLVREVPGAPGKTPVGFSRERQEPFGTRPTSAEA